MITIVATGARERCPSEHPRRWQPFCRRFVGPAKYMSHGPHRHQCPCHKCPRSAQRYECAPVKTPIGFRWGVPLERPKVTSQLPRCARCARPFRCNFGSTMCATRKQAVSVMPCYAAMQAARFSRGFPRRGQRSGRSCACNLGARTAQEALSASEPLSSRPNWECQPPVHNRLPERRDCLQRAHVQ